MDTIYIREKIFCFRIIIFFLLTSTVLAQRTTEQIDKLFEEYVKNNKNNLKAENIPPSKDTRNIIAKECEYYNGILNSTIKFDRLDKNTLIINNLDKVIETTDAGYEITVGDRLIQFLTYIEINSKWLGHPKYDLFIRHYNIAKNGSTKNLKDMISLTESLKIAQEISAYIISNWRIKDDSMDADIDKGIHVIKE